MPNMNLGKRSDNVILPARLGREEKTNITQVRKQ